MHIYGNFHCWNNACFGCFLKMLLRGWYPTWNTSASQGSQHQHRFPPPPGSAGWLTQTFHTSHFTVLTLSPTEWIMFSDLCMECLPSTFQACLLKTSCQLVHVSHDLVSCPTKQFKKNIYKAVDLPTLNFVTWNGYAFQPINFFVDPEIQLLNPWQISISRYLISRMHAPQGRLLHYRMNCDVCVCNMHEDVAFVVTYWLESPNFPQLVWFLSSGEVHLDFKKINLQNFEILI